MTMRIYVGTYAKYNDGNLFGKWLDLEYYIDKEEFLKACAERAGWVERGSRCLGSVCLYSQRIRKRERPLFQHKTGGFCEACPRRPETLNCLVWLETE